MTQPFHNKVIIITGAASGIGRASSIKLSLLGANLALCDINESGLLETLAQLQPRYNTSSIVNIASSDAVNDFVSTVITKHGHVDHVFNCAGVNPTLFSTQDITDEYWDKIVNTNLKGLFNVTRASIPHLRSGASFVNVSSIAGLRPMAGFAVYCASKYGVIGFSKAMALELGPRGMRTNVVAPGYIDTPTNASVLVGPERVAQDVQKVALGRVGTAEDVADVVSFLFSDESRYMNGSVVEVTGGV